ncbi:MAG: HutP family protein [Thermacetogeniaceae bacterium]|nr:hut operon transcriptional regulator HutP [Syntrophomonadaceae bacterium]
MLDEITIGKLAVLLAVSSDAEEKEILQKGEQAGYKLFKGRVGSMDGEKIFAAVETAAKRREIIENQYREEHALYHSILDAFHGVCRGELALGSVLRSVGLVFSVVRGPRMAGDYSDGEWLAVALYGNIGAPIKGFEHEVIGLGINNV